MQETGSQMRPVLYNAPADIASSYRLGPLLDLRSKAQRSPTVDRPAKTAYLLVHLGSCRVFLCLGVSIDNTSVALLGLLIVVNGSDCVIILSAQLAPQNRRKLTVVRKIDIGTRDLIQESDLLLSSVDRAGVLGGVVANGPGDDRDVCHVLAFAVVCIEILDALRVRSVVHIARMIREADRVNLAFGREPLFCVFRPGAA